jgi:multidrug transporter EmrE-like cation transporter
LIERVIGYSAAVRAVGARTPLVRSAGTGYAVWMGIGAVLTVAWIAGCVIGLKPLH